MQCVELLACKSCDATGNIASTCLHYYVMLLRMRLLRFTVELWPLCRSCTFLEQNTLPKYIAGCFLIALSLLVA